MGYLKQTCHQFIWIIAALALLGLGRAWAEEGPVMGGTVEARIGDRTVNFPSLRSDYQAEVEGDLVTVTVTQTFANPSDQALNATYLFPLPTTAAVFKMEMEVGEERVEARIQRVEEARASYEKARDEGRAAALLTQKRPNMFTQEIANLMPGLPVKVTLSYVQVANRVDGRYELVMPLVVGPRYQPLGRGVEDGQDEMPAPTAVAPTGEGGGRTGPDGSPPISVEASKQAQADSRKKYGVWELESLPAYPPVSGLTIPKIIDEDRVSLRVKLRAGQPISRFDSPTHALADQKISDREISLSLASGRTIDNRDFILHWSLAGDQTQPGLLAHKDERGGFFSLLIEPPAAPRDEDLTPREMVFVLDTSGSMRGRPLAACQVFMQKALQTLRPKDYFRIVTFDNAAREFSDGAVSASPDNIKRGLDYVNGLQASGGTEAASGVRQALDQPQHPGTLRLVVFMTDGFIGNEAQVLQLTNEIIGQARILSFGVGTSVNRYFLEELAREGRGWCQVLDPSADVDEVTAAMAGRLDAPVLTDISIDWGGEVSEVAPDPVPDLFAGQSVRVMGRYEKGGPREVVVSGLSGARRARMPLKIDLPDQPDPAGAQAIPLIWARETIAELSRQFHRPRGGGDLNALKERITVMGLTYNLVTTWTAFVAVSKQVVNQNGAALEVQIPLPQVKGVEAEAYGLTSNGASRAALGQAAPLASPARLATSKPRSQSNLPSLEASDWGGFSSGAAEPEAGSSAHPEPGEVMAPADAAPLPQANEVEAEGPGVASPSSPADMAAPVVAIDGGEASSDFSGGAILGGLALIAVIAAGWAALKRRKRP